ncbi:hypothetical protein VIBNISOn1_1160099 [Vibrio nigripulchritudo SOn1]|uniref:Transposase n=1 Tax=Vibrio nigripulchritudo SOn1 TaxID=1238450 RepID=A0AAV2VIV8_9VIBR|nr:hypothetical protein VIBNISOn1_1160099 [Vibrio nigripulchritudo SOn1]
MRKLLKRYCLQRIIGFRKPTKAHANQKQRNYVFHTNPIYHQKAYLNPRVIHLLHTMEIQNGYLVSNQYATCYFWQTN